MFPFVRTFILPSLILMILFNSSLQSEENKPSSQDSIDHVRFALIDSLIKSNENLQATIKSNPSNADYEMTPLLTYFSTAGLFLLLLILIAIVILLNKSKTQKYSSEMGAPYSISSGEYKEIIDHILDLKNQLKGEDGIFQKSIKEIQGIESEIKTLLVTYENGKEVPLLKKIIESQNKFQKATERELKDRLDTLTNPQREIGLGENANSRFTSIESALFELKNATNNLTKQVEKLASESGPKFNFED